MLQKYPWAVGLRIPKDTISSWESQCGDSELLRWAIANGKLPEFGYQEWAKAYYQLPSLSIEFFDKNPDPKLWEKWGGYAWSGSFLPIYEWESQLYIACLEPPDFEQSKLVEQLGVKVALVIAPMSGMKKWWHILQPSFEKPSIAPANNLPPELAVFAGGAGVARPVTATEPVISKHQAPVQSQAAVAPQDKPEVVMQRQVVIEQEPKQTASAAPPQPVAEANSTIQPQQAVAQDRIKLRDNNESGKQDIPTANIIENQEIPVPDINIGMEPNTIPSAPTAPVEVEQPTAVLGAPEEVDLVPPPMLQVENSQDVNMNPALGIPEESIIDFNIHGSEFPEDFGVDTTAADSNLTSSFTETKELPSVESEESLEIESYSAAAIQEPVADAQNSQGLIDETVMFQQESIEPQEENLAPLAPELEPVASGDEFSFEVDGSDDLLVLSDDSDSLSAEDSNTEQQEQVEEESLEGFDDIVEANNASSDLQLEGLNAEGVSLEAPSAPENLSGDSEELDFEAMLAADENQFSGIETTNVKPPSPHLVPDDDDAPMPTTAPQAMSKPLKVSHPDESREQVGAAKSPMSNSGKIISDSSEDSFDSEQAIAKTALDSASEYFDRVMILHNHQQILKPFLWQGLWNHNKNISSSIDLSMSSIFRIVATSHKPYHGYVVRNQVNDNFFNAFNQGELPAHATLVPVTIEGSVIGMLLGFADQQTAEHIELERIEKIADDYSKKIIELNRSKISEAA